MTSDPLAAPEQENAVTVLGTGFIGPATPEFPLEWALKDVHLAIAAANGTTLPVLEAVSRQWHTVVEAATAG